MNPLYLPGTLHSVRAIGKYVLAAAEKAGLESQAAYRLRQAVDEIATNAVIHGYQACGANGYLEIAAVFDETKLAITLVDISPAFDPLSVPPPADLEWRTGDRPAGGLGVFLALRGVDEFRHEWVNEQNRNTFVQYIHPEKPLRS
jgi:anti-sigma regulatory factor (Ser/Thr protein kinase)